LDQPSKSDRLAAPDVPEIDGDRSAGCFLCITGTSDRHERVGNFGFSDCQCAGSPKGLGVDVETY